MCAQSGVVISRMEQHKKQSLSLSQRNHIECMKKQYIVLREEEEEPPPSSSLKYIYVFTQCSASAVQQRRRSLALMLR